MGIERSHQPVRIGRVEWLGGDRDIHPVP